MTSPVTTRSRRGASQKRLVVPDLYLHRISLATWKNLLGLVAEGLPRSKRRLGPFYVTSGRHHSGNRAPDFPERHYPLLRVHSLLHITLMERPEIKTELEILPVNLILPTDNKHRSFCEDDRLGP